MGVRALGAVAATGYAARAAAALAVTFATVLSDNALAAPGQVQVARPAFNLSPDDIIARYNAFSAQVDKTIKVPMAGRWKPGGANPVFHGINYEIDRSLQLNLEVVNATKQPFSFGFLAAPSGDRTQALRTAIVMVGIGTAVFGKGDNSDALVVVCKRASAEPSSTATDRRAGLDVYCAVADGVWMGGISVPKN